MSHKHTPGPWYPPDVDCPDTHSTNDVKIHMPTLRGLTWSERMARYAADGRLAAAAPTMLEALEKCVALLVRYENRSMMPEVGTATAIDEATAAIALATKETP